MSIPTVQTFIQVINSLLPEPHASLLSGMVFGARRSMPPDFYQALVNTGTLHVIALSGQNIAIITNIVATFCLHFTSRKVSSLLTIVIIASFVYFVGSDPPVVRAALMGGLSLISIIFGKQNWSLLSLFFASIIMILIHPDWLSSISFQLSFGASLGIILFGSAKQKPILGKIKMNKNENYVTQGSNENKNTMRIFQPAIDTIKQDLRLTIAAQIFTVPIILIYFGRISLISPLANILIGWIVPFLTIIGIIIALVGWIFLPLAYPLALIVWVPLTYFIQIVKILSNLPFSSIQI